MKINQIKKFHFVYYKCRPVYYYSVAHVLNRSVIFKVTCNCVVLTSF